MSFGSGTAIYYLVECLVLLYASIDRYCGINFGFWNCSLNETSKQYFICTLQMLCTLKLLLLVLRLISGSCAFSIDKTGLFYNFFACNFVCCTLCIGICVVLLRVKFIVLFDVQGQWHSFNTSHLGSLTSRILCRACWIS